jgi:hypothetical protein
LIAAGLTPEGDARRKLLHAGTCPRCGALLKQAIADFSDQITPEEEKELESLQTSRPEWQEAYARR